MKLTDNEARERIEAVFDRCQSCALNVNGRCHSQSCYLRPGDSWWARNCYTIAHRTYLTSDWDVLVVANQTPCHAYHRRDEL